MRKLFWLAVAVLAASAPVAAQDAEPGWEIGGGYSFLSANIITGCRCVHLQGANVSVGHQFNNWFGVFGDLGGYRSEGIRGTGLDLQLVTYQFGPRVYYRGHERAHAFGHFLMGGGRASGGLYRQPIPNRRATGADYGLMITLGGGVDFKLGGRTWLRLVQAEWVHSRFDNGSNNLQNNVRLSTGVVIRLGDRD